MKKKTLSLALALALCLGLTVPAFAAESDFIIENGILTDYNVYGEDAASDLVIPNGVTSIGDYSCGYYEKIISVTIPNGVISIGEGAFLCCDGMKRVTIPASVASIGESAFFGCTSLADVFYGGTEAQWKAVTIYEGNDPLKAATIHYSGSTDTPAEPEQPVTPPAETIPASGTAKASTQTVTVDGKAVEFQMYALVDANGNGTNYIKLRDMAYVLNGTKAQFAVGYDNATKSISLTTGQAYEASGAEMTTPYSGDRAYQGGPQTLKIDGKDVTMTAITLTDDNGGGYNYFKLRDLGKALGFNVGWSKEAGVFIESDKPYTE